MNADLDVTLRHLAAQPTHPGLPAMEDRVLACIGTAGRGDRTSYMAGVAAAVGAIALGVAGASPAAPAANPLSPFGPSSSLAPSTLLASAE